MLVGAHMGQQKMLVHNLVTTPERFVRVYSCVQAYRGVPVATATTGEWKLWLAWRDLLIYKWGARCLYTGQCVT